MVWIQHPRAQLHESADGKLRDQRHNIDHFMWKKFGPKWKQKLRRGEIPQDVLNAAHAEFKAMLKG